VGNSGSGKTTLARAIAGRIGAPHVELDSIYHQPRWTPLPDDEFRARVGEIVRGDAWVLDGNYHLVSHLVAHADTVVWIDLPRSTVMRQLVKRTLSRGVLRRELWNGNRESLRNFVRLDPEKSILRWAWTRHAVYGERFRAAAAPGGAWDGLTVVRLRSPADVRAFVDSL
jgi:adenylate kinase family enzyme